MTNLRGQNRSKDIIDYVEALSARKGAVCQVGPNYYSAFLHLTQLQVEKLVVVLLLEQEKEVRRLTSNKPSLQSIQRVASFIGKTLKVISIGLASFDCFGRLIITARIGSEPTAKMSDALERHLEKIQPVIENTVRKTLPWLLSRDVTQRNLPL
jgi:hypothetical protein